MNDKRLYEVTIRVSRAKYETTLVVADNINQAMAMVQAQGFVVTFAISYDFENQQ